MENHRGISIIQHFFQGELNYVICFREAENQTFSAESGFTGQMFTGKLSRVDSATKLKQVVFFLSKRFFVIHFQNLQEFSRFPFPFIVLGILLMDTGTSFLVIKIKLKCLGKKKKKLTMR